MPTVSPIVAAVDLTAGSEPAVAWALSLSRRTGAGLHLVHVRPARGEGGPPAGDAAALRAWLGGVAPGGSRLARRPYGPARPEATVRVVDGASVPGAVLGYGKAVGAGLLVVGAHGRAGAGRLLVGGVTRACVAQAPFPVLTVSGGAGACGPSPSAPVLAAVDFGPQSAGVLREAVRLAEACGARLEVVHVARDVGPYAGLPTRALSLSAVDPERAASVRRRLDRLAGDAPVADVHVALGAPSRQVAAVAATLGAASVVVGTHGRSGPAHALVGSTACATLQRAGCAVLTVRPDAGPAWRTPPLCAASA